MVLNCHLLVVYLPVDVSTLTILNLMCQIGQGDYESRPRSISSNAYHVTSDFTDAQVSYSGGEEITLQVEGQVKEAFRIPWPARVTSATRLSPFL